MKRPLVRVVCAIHKGETVGRMVGSSEGPTWRMWMPAVAAKRAVIGDADSGVTAHDHMVMALIREKHRAEVRGEPVTKPIPKIVGPLKSGRRLKELGMYHEITLAEGEAKWGDHLPAWCGHCRIYRAVPVAMVRDTLAKPPTQRVLAV